MIQADLDQRMQQDLSRRLIAINEVGAVFLAAAEQQFVGHHNQTGIIDWLPPNEDIPHDELSYTTLTELYPPPLLAKSVIPITSSLMAMSTRSAKLPLHIFNIILPRNFSIVL